MFKFVCLFALVAAVVANPIGFDGGFDFNSNIGGIGGLENFGSVNTFGGFGDFGSFGVQPQLSQPISYSQSIGFGQSGFLSADEPVRAIDLGDHEVTSQGEEGTARGGIESLPVQDGAEAYQSQQNY
ncbi:uncharacterized protein LOC129770120 [Toxorhynchites rutilus septentrionalis]|uniref:uncharacterized protein LOC129770120 n=1 Tax=Toxorhynchites rutilus septentrionalis TaxID=329112 RepID=UPI002478F733|nr:uncharacterized protein LOC129770120 [Toxorhynchites rutilus septentrionalis]